MENPMQSNVAEGDDLPVDAGAHDQPFRVVKYVEKDQKYAQEALEVAGLAEKTADEALVAIIAGVPADGPSGTLNVVAARRVIHAIEDAGYKITAMDAGYKITK